MSMIDWNIQISVKSLAVTDAIRRMLLRGCQVEQIECAMCVVVVFLCGGRRMRWNEVAVRERERLINEYIYGPEKGLLSIGRVKVSLKRSGEKNNYEVT